MPVLYCKKTFFQTDPFNFSFNNFLSSHQNYTVPLGEATSIVHYFVHAVPRLQPCELHITMRKPDGTLVTYDRYFTEENNESGVWYFPADYGSLISNDRFTFPQDGEPVSYTLKVGNRIARFYVVNYSRYLQFMYANIFGFTEEAFLPLQLKQKTTTKQSLAQSLHTLMPYDRQHTIEFECQTAALTIEQALQAVEMLCSHRVQVRLPHELETHDIITDYTAEIDDNPGTQNIIKFSFRLANTTADSTHLIADKFSRIFSDQYKKQFN